MAQQTLPPYEYDESETENREFDPEVEPTEYECNTCGWHGCPSSAITMCGGETARNCAARVAAGTPKFRNGTSSARTHSRSR
jgi:hypothetical protein